LIGEIQGGLKNCKGMLIHLDIEPPVRHSLSYTNGHRPWELFVTVFYGWFKTVTAKTQNTCKPGMKLLAASYREYASSIIGGSGSIRS